MCNLPVQVVCRANAEYMSPSGKCTNHLHYTCAWKLWQQYLILEISWSYCMLHDAVACFLLCYRFFFLQETEINTFSSLNCIKRQCCKAKVNIPLTLLCVLNVNCLGQDGSRWKSLVLTLDEKR